MKKTLLATVAALGLFAAGATFASMNPAARPAQEIAASENTGSNQVAAAENDHQDHALFAAAENDHTGNGQSRANDRNGNQLAAAENDHNDHAQFADNDRNTSNDGHRGQAGQQFADNDRNTSNDGHRGQAGQQFASAGNDHYDHANG